MKMDDVTVGIKSFFRPEKLELCLESLADNPHQFNEIIVADDGKISDKKKKIYDRYKEKLPLTLLDLEFDYGLAASRNKIVEKMNGNYLLLLDDDMTVPGNIDLMKRLLQQEDSLGGISGMLYENGSFQAKAHDIFIKKNMFGKTLVRDIREDKKDIIPTNLGEKTIYRYDFILTCALFKKECLKDYQWDPEYKIEKEHLDFYLNLKQNSSWNFALTEEVIFGHYPGGSIDFEEHRQDDQKHRNSEEYFKQKWGMDRIAWTDQHHYSNKDISRNLKNKIKNMLPSEAYLAIQKINMRLLN